MDVGGVCCVRTEISWICFFVLKVNVVCCGRVVDKIFEWLDILMIGITYRVFFVFARGLLGEASEKYHMTSGKSNGCIQCNEILELGT